MLLSVLQRTATHCNALQHTATHSPIHSVIDVVECVATHCNILQHTATHCNTLQHIHLFIQSLMLLSVLQPTATYCNALQHTTTHCNTFTYSFSHWRCWVSVLVEKVCLCADDWGIDPGWFIHSSLSRIHSLIYSVIDVVESMSSRRNYVCVQMT